MLLVIAGGVLLSSQSAGALAGIGTGGASTTGSAHAAVASRGYVPANPYTDGLLPKGTSESTLGTLYKEVKASKVTRATVDPINDLVFFVTTAKKRFAASFIDGSGGRLSSYLLAHNVNVTVGTFVLATKSSFGGLLTLMLCMSLFGAFVTALLRRQKRREAAYASSAPGQGKGAGGRRGRTDVVDIPETRFCDVAGNEEAVQDLGEYAEFLLHPEKFEATGAEMPKGALLCGPPGTGKTLLARAVAGEAGVPFYSVAGSDFVEMYVGVGAKRVRELFAKARKHERSIIFIDEIDAIGRKRSSSETGSSQEGDQTLNALLHEMDGFHESKVVVLAATNRPDVLDPAIMRPGRLDRRIEVVLPDRRGREKVLAVHCGKRPAIGDDVDLEALARRTPGMSGAELARVVNEACIEAARASATVVTSKHFDAAIELVAMGRARVSAIVTPKDRLVTAWHEAGHTVCAYVQDEAHRPVSVSIIPRGKAGGITWMAEGDDQFLTRSKASAQLVVALGGRAAEMMLLNDDFTQGAYGDLTTATELATTMVLQYGMTSVGLTVHDPSRLGANKATHADEVVEELLASSLEQATAALRDREPFFRAIVEKLLDLDTLNAAELDEIYQSIEHPGAKISATLLEPLSRAAAPRPVPRTAQVPTPLGPRRSREGARSRDLVAAVERRVRARRPKRASTT
jgi:cell division protease FtsH